MIGNDRGGGKVRTRVIDLLGVVEFLAGLRHADCAGYEHRSIESKGLGQYCFFAIIFNKKAY